MPDLLMPRLSDSMEEGTILTWLAADGEDVAEGQDLVEIETDKATMTHAAEHAGALSIVAAAGTTVAVGEVIARVGEPGAAEPASAVATRAPSANGAPAPTRSGRGAATPMARRIAHAHGITLDALHGTGPRGRVVRADVLRAAGLEPEPAPATTAERVVEPSRVQRVIARRMAESRATIPDFQVQTDVEMTAALAFREQLKALDLDPTPSLNDLIVKASALALRRHPRANGSYVDGGFALHDHVNVGVAVAADDALVVPVVHDADALGLGRIAEATRRLAQRVRDGEITPPELSGATFTVSNLGMYGMTAITPVIDPPQAAILGVGAIREALARGQDGELVDRRPLTLTLTCDHRILYGADAARFLAAIRALLEAPAGLAL